MNDPVLSNLDPNSSEFKEGLARQLSRLDPTKPAGTQLCDAMMRLWPSVAFEAVALRTKNGVREVYLRRRAMDDTAYPGEWHAPGSIYRNGERDRDVVNRLEKEFGVPILAFRYIDKHTTDEQRGTIHSMIFGVELRGDPRIDDRHKWFPVDDMPSNTVSFHKDLYIPLVAKR